jgi:hypothetical protein
VLTLINFEELDTLNEQGLLVVDHDAKVCGGDVIVI